MNRRTFNSLLAAGNFKELFITEMGWNKPQGQAQLPEYAIDEAKFDIRVVAQRNGFQILTSAVTEIPTISVARKLDGKLRRQANDYILIFTIPQSEHQCWICPVKQGEKREMVLVEYADLSQIDFLFSKIDGLCFEVDETTTIIDVRERVHHAFAVNSEKITKDFYAGFRKEHKAFAQFIEGIDTDKDRQWYTSVMLNRLMFCYFIQKKGFLNGDVDYLSNKLKEVQRMRGEDKFYHTFYLDFLIQLFHDGLNAPRHTPEWEQRFGRIPYLNGGMFDVHLLEQEYPDIDIPDEAFERLFAFFDTWQWHLDTRITASGKDINPDVLGYIFEQYINDRAAMGAYYTKEDITEYISKNCILPYLFDRVEESSSRDDFKPQGYVWKTLRDSGDRYIYDAVKKGYSVDWQQLIPENIAIGIDTTNPNLLDRRKDWNAPTAEAFALPTEIWRETVERLQRCDSLTKKIVDGEITKINDFITYNLNIRLFAEDLLARTSNHHFVANFYHALQQVTILDPTCGSGAFLFAAMNILEPLYETCIQRMEEFQAGNPNLFKKELDEISHKYRSNIQYFIYKSIILRNLYGVDIMVEATEIAKLRLFLKMVAVVEMDRRADNMGLDPLPDIDFNIRCGNTLVGYATEAELKKGLIEGDAFAREELEQKVNSEMEVVATTYKRFKQVQMTQENDMAAFKQAKTNLRQRLSALNDLLNRHMYGPKRAKPYNQWLADTQPFHWLAEFYDIIQGNGGFDVIIGNPPYVVYNKNTFPYKVPTNYKTIDCINLYAYCVERSYTILADKCRFGMIVPNSSISATKMEPLQKIISKNKNCWITNYSWRPSKLFEGADMLLAIILNEKSSQKNVFSSCYHKWYNEYRPVLFQYIEYFNVSDVMLEGSIPKIPGNLALSILQKTKEVSKHCKLADRFLSTSSYKFYYFRAVQYWFKVLDKEPIFEEDGVHMVTGEMKPIYVSSEEEEYATIAILSSSTYFLYYILWSSCQVVNSRDFNLPFDIKQLSDNISALYKLGSELQQDYQIHSHVKVRNYSKRGRIFTMEKQHFFIKYSKPIIDEIDKVLAKHYGFTEEELDFIINYDIKYRMGDELNNE